MWVRPSAINSRKAPWSCEETAAETLYRGCESIQRRGRVRILCLDLEVDVRAFIQEVRAERLERAERRAPKRAGCFRQRQRECDDRRVRERQHVRHQSIVFVERQVEQSCRRRAKQLFHFGRRLVVSCIADDDVAVAQQHDRRAEHRMDRRDARAGLLQRANRRDQRGLDTRDIDDGAGGRCRSPLVVQHRGGRRRSGADDQIGGRQCRAGPRILLVGGDEIEGTRRVALIREKPHEPSAHPPLAADNDRGLARAERGAPNAIAILSAHGRANQAGQNRVGDVRIQACALGCRTGPIEHSPLLGVVHDRQADATLFLADFTGERDAPGGRVDDVRVQLADLFPSCSTVSGIGLFFLTRGTRVVPAVAPC